MQVYYINQVTIQVYYVAIDYSPMQTYYIDQVTKQMYYADQVTM